MHRRKTMFSSSSMKRKIVFGSIIAILCLSTTAYFSLDKYVAESVLAQDGVALPLSSSRSERPSSMAEKAKKNSATSKCQPKTKIGFMKTHKTASSTVQNILFRFGLDNELNFVLPGSGNHLNDPAHQYIVTEPFKVEWLDQEKHKLPWHETLKETQAYDVFNLHTQWNYSAVKQLLGPEVMTFTILRHPVDLFESLYSYADFKSVLKLDIHEYIQSLNVSTSLYQHRVNQYLGLNQQLFDLGQPLSQLYSQKATNELIEKLEKEFDLVLLAEKFDESMVFLAAALCWPLNQVKSFVVNARKQIHKVELKLEEREILESWQAGDMKLYRHFEDKFLRKMEAYGIDKLKEEVKKLQALNKEAHDNCVISQSDKAHMDKNSMYRPFSPEVIAYKIRQDLHECRLLAMAENSLVELARTRQRVRWESTSTSTNH